MESIEFNDKQLLDLLYILKDDHWRWLGNFKEGRCTESSMKKARAVTTTLENIVFREVLKRMSDGR